MTEKQLYKNAASRLHASPDTVAAVMKKGKAQRNKRRRPAAFTAAVLAAIVLCGAGAYAADIGGLRHTIQIWYHGNETDAVLETGDGEYRVTFIDRNGEAHQSSGGGFTTDAFGNTRPLTEEELEKEAQETMNDPNVVWEDDGTVLVYYYDQCMDITDHFQDGVCHVKLIHGWKVLYLSVSEDGSYGISNRCYPD